MMIDFKKLNRLSYITRRMYIIKCICELKDIDLEYLFGLFDLYNKKNRGRWFWQKTSFTGMLKDASDNFNAILDEIVKDLKQADERKTNKQIESASGVLDKLLVGLETNCSVNRVSDFNYVKGFLSSSFKALITDNLKGTE